MLITAQIEKAKQMEREQTVDFAEDYEIYESDKYPRKTFEQYSRKIQINFSVPLGF